MLDVFFTVDVEIWCDGWLDIERKFPESFQKYVYGQTSRGSFGLPYQLQVLNAHGLTGVFFVEPLFSACFGNEPLAEIVGLINEAGQEVQLHLHTEWVDEAKEPLLKNSDSKRQHLRYFSSQEQAILVTAGINFLRQAGAEGVNAFRAGSFAFNRDTYGALKSNGIAFDSSYNASLLGTTSGVLPGVTAVDSFACEGVFEFPMTVYKDGTPVLRHAQLTACSYRELEGLLWQAAERERRSFVFLSHNFECLNGAKNRPDDVVVKRFERLCSFLSRNRDAFRVRGFRGLQPQVAAQQPTPLVSPLWKTGARMIEQIARRRYR